MMREPSDTGEEIKPRITAAIPCLNASGSIEGVVTKARKHVSQVVVVDDGSRDGTLEAALAAGAVVVVHDANKGYGEAVKSCFELARTSATDILVTLDGDGQHDADEIPRLIAPIIHEEADLVIGSRFLNKRADVPRYRKFGIRAITFLFNLASRIRVSDAQSGFRAYNQKTFNNLVLTEQGMGISIETLEKIRQRGFTIKEVPISCLYSSSVINLGAIRHGLGVALSVFRIRLKNNLSGKADE